MGGSFLPSRSHPAPPCTGLPPPLQPAPSPPRLPSCPGGQRPQVSSLMPPGCRDLWSRSLMLPDSGQAGHLWIHPLLEWGPDLCVCPKATRAASREGSTEWGAPLWGAVESQ